MGETEIIGRLGALADRTRSRLLLLLERQELAVSELCAVVGLPQSTVSRHLRILWEGGWVVWRAEGTKRYYRRTAQLDRSAAQVWQVVAADLADTLVAKEDAARARMVLGRRRMRSEAFFSSAAGQWEELRADLFGTSPEDRALLGLLSPGLVVGDLGCGTGQVTELLSPFVARVIALDRSPEMLAAARARLTGLSNVDICQADLESQPIGNDQLDAALIFLVLHYVANPGLALVETARVLKPGGHLLIVDMVTHGDVELRDRLGHVWQGFGSERLDGWLQASGFETGRFVLLPPEADTRGPPLFLCSARRAN